MKNVKFFAIIMCICLLFNLASCSKSTVNLSYQVKYDTIYRKFSETILSEEINKYGISSEPVPLAMQQEINALHKDVLTFINSKYNLNWKYKEVSAYLVDLNHLGYLGYVAMADPRYERFYLNSSWETSDYENIYRSVHELIHCIRYNNIGKSEFTLEKNSKILGYYVGESLTDLLTSEYFENLGDSKAYEFFLNSSQYCYTTVAAKIIEYSIPNLCYYYLIDDIDTLSKEFNSIASNSINLNADYFERFANYSDILMISVKEYLYLNDSESISKLRSCMLANFELVVAASRNLENSSQVIDEIEYLFELENATSAYKDFILHLKSLL